MQNPWKLTTLLLAGVLAMSHARAEGDWKQTALTHLQSAAKILSEHGGANHGKASPNEDEIRKKNGPTPTSKALELTRAAIIQLKRAAS